MKFSLVEVERFPDSLEPGRLYWSKEFGMSAHLCACGCGDVIYLPIGPVDYSIVVSNSGPTLRPSVGNWNVCDAHYFITNGQVEWAPKWTPEQIALGRDQEDKRREAYYASPKRSFLKTIMQWIRQLLGF
jgi:Family of unknown function (DUF6527)